ncbi:hypothetical protein [Mesorhizobium sp.]|uniref:hypothetical protein n=1 Tax=Mesorhizobium sp. TaxID=1871066 RepID=UPI0025E3C02B|nr:hypothetical protein [Mesorhizobium sp.]
MDEQDPREDLVETVFRNGTVTAVGILLAFSLGFITHWAANPIPWQTYHLVAVLPILAGIALQMRALSLLSTRNACSGASMNVPTASSWPA